MFTEDIWKDFSEDRRYNLYCILEYFGYLRNLRGRLFSSEKFSEIFGNLYPLGCTLKPWNVELRNGLRELAAFTEHKRLAIGDLAQTLSGSNRAMQPRCAMRFESHIPKSLAMRRVFFFPLAMRKHIRLIWNHRKMPEKKPLRKSCDVGLRREKSEHVFGIERCEMPAIRTPATVWPAMRAPAMPNR